MTNLQAEFLVALETLKRVEKSAKETVDFIFADSPLRGVCTARTGLKQLVLVLRLMQYECFAARLAKAQAARASKALAQYKGY